MCYLHKFGSQQADDRACAVQAVKTVNLAARSNFQKMRAKAMAVIDFVGLNAPGEPEPEPEGEDSSSDDDFDPFAKQKKKKVTTFNTR